MKNYKLLALAGCLWASCLWSQTADQYVAMGRTNLVAHNFPAANADFTNALALLPNHAEANALAAATRLLLLPTRPPGSNFLNRLGLAAAGRDMYSWTAQMPVDTNGDVILPSNYNSTEAISFYRTNVMPALGASRTNLARITDTGFLLSLTADETGVGQAVTVDYGDILLLRAGLYAAEFLGYTLTAHNFSVVINHIKDLGEADTLTVQRILSDYPSLLTLSSASDLAASKGPFTNAINVYLAASDFIRNQRPAGAQRLFNLDTNDLAGEAEFRTQLTNALLSLNAPVLVNTNEAISLYLSNYFAGAKSLRSLVPKFIGDRYVENTLPDFTFGGILSGVPACDVEAMLRKMFDRPDAGIYTSDVYGQYGLGPVLAGGFAAFLGTNLQASIIGYDENLPSGAFVQFTVQSGGEWYFETNGTSDQGGPFRVNSHGSFGKDGSFSGYLDYFHTNGDFWFSHTLNGNFSSPLGDFQSAAGVYSGNWSGGSESGKLYATLTADGSVYFCGFSPLGDVSGGGIGEFDTTNHFTGAMTDGTLIAGTLNASARTMSGTFTNSQISGQWNMSRFAFAPFDVPPTITTPPTNKTVALCSNATFNVVASGSPPLCYQWFSNNVAIARATNTSLVLSNVAYATAADYSVRVRNVADGVEATATLTVVPESIKPTNQIVTPTAGLQVSNAEYVVTGRAGDNVQVSNVWYQLNTEDWKLASTTNNWANWWAEVTLTPGTNVIRAVAVDTSGNVSATNSVSFVYVQSAQLIVLTNGLGTVSPNYNGAWLQIGKNYSMTATAGSGFQFTNWTGSLVTNGATLTFTMASNLAFTANFVDVTRPTLTVTSPTSGQRVSNAVFTVRGTAGDNWQLDGVQFQLNGGGWTNAIGTTNWSRDVDLTPGTNTLLAYAVDTTGNRSVTNSVSFQYVVSAPLQVQLTGLGSVSPNYSNALLAVGQSYTMTASPGTGFMFTNWTGGTDEPLEWLTNGTTVRFVMESNLILQANFIDTSKPTLSITNLASGQRVSNAVFTVRGTATDNWQISNVWCQIVGKGWSNASSANHWTNWSAADLPLTPGTNVLLAYAVDIAGNRSVTNSVSFQYVVSAPLQVQMAGVGTLNPNYSNAVLAVGQNYSMTATPGTGFMFTNWTGGTDLPLSWRTNGTTLQFQMQSNLILQANFIDTSKPTLSITNLTSGQRISNAVFAVKGTAGDNWVISNVWYRLNGAGWSNSSTANVCTNWSTADLSLTPGTNTFLAYAVDTTGNRSTTNSVNFQYIVSAPLQVQMTGLGSLSPNYSNAVLAIGTIYTMTASAGTGFMFTNWTGGMELPLNWLTNGTTLQFRMQSNLILQANFIDTTKPTSSNTNLISGQRVSNAVFTVRGTAGDNWRLGGVQYQLNNLGWSNALTANAWSNWWSSEVTLMPGTNLMLAYAVDTTGNRSATNSVSFQFVVTNQLGVRANGLGTISPNYSNAWLELGRNYSMSASAGSGFMFTNWMISTNWEDGVKTNNTTVQFMMKSNLTLQVSFVDVTRPTVSITAPTSGQRLTNALANVRGTAGDNWRVTNVWYQLNSNAWSVAITTNNWTNWSVTLTLTAGTNTVRAYAVDLGANFSLTNSVSFVSSNTFQLQLSIAAGASMTTNGLDFGLQVSPGLNGRIQASTNLMTWTTLTNFVGTNAVIYLRDPAATNLNLRFYRAVTP